MKEKILQKYGKKPSWNLFVDSAEFYFVQKQYRISKKFANSQL